MRALPTEIKKLKKTNRADRGAVEPIVFESISTKIPKPPNYFGERAKEEWTAILKQYQAIKIFSILDLPSLAIYCKAVETLEKIEDKLEDGSAKRYFTTESGYEAVHPIVTIRNKCIEEIKNFGERLGLTPVSRTKVSGLLNTKKETRDEFEAAYG